MTKDIFFAVDFAAVDTVLFTHGSLLAISPRRYFLLINWLNGFEVYDSEAVDRQEKDLQWRVLGVATLVFAVFMTGVTIVIFARAIR